MRYQNILNKVKANASDYVVSYKGESYTFRDLKNAKKYIRDIRDSERVSRFHEMLCKEEN